jgi:hypothetical protein
MQCLVARFASKLVSNSVCDVKLLFSLPNHGFSYYFQQKEMSGRAEVETEQPNTTYLKNLPFKICQRFPSIDNESLPEIGDIFECRLHYLNFSVSLGFAQELRSQYTEPLGGAVE